MSNEVKREAWLQELKRLRKQLIETTKETKDHSATSNSKAKMFVKTNGGLESKMYDDKQAAKVRVLMLALITFLFETLFFIGSYLLFRK